MVLASYKIKTRLKKNAPNFRKVRGIQINVSNRASLAEQACKNFIGV
jgi:hypothetical protein